MTWWLISMATAFQPATSWQHLDDTHLSRNYPLSSMGGYIYLQPDRYGLLRFESSLRMAGTPIPSIGKEACLNGRVVANHTTPSILCCDATNILTWDTREYAAEDSLLWSAVDVDNDGFDDLIGYEALHLYRDDGYHSVPYPPPTVDALVSTEHPIADLTGDGRADLLRSYYTGEEFMGYFYNFHAGIIALHPGGADGFGDAAWELQLHKPLIDALPLQLDADPQLELIGLVASSLDSISSELGQVALVRIDFDSHGEPEQVTEEPWLQNVTMFCTTFCWPTLHAVGDVDGDSFDDVLLAISHLRTPIESSALHILTGTNGFDLAAPLLRLQETTERMEGVNRKQALTADLNGDGLLDVVMSRDNEDFDGSSTLQVWFAPFLEPPTPTTTPDTTDTGTAAPTGDTSRSSPPQPPNGANDGRGCSCNTSPVSLSWLAFALPWFLARRLWRETP